LTAAFVNLVKRCFDLLRLSREDRRENPARAFQRKRCGPAVFTQAGYAIAAARRDQCEALAAATGGHHAAGLDRLFQPAQARFAAGLGRRF